MKKKYLIGDAKIRVEQKSFILDSSVIEGNKIIVEKLTENEKRRILDHLKSHDCFNFEIIGDAFLKYDYFANAYVQKAKKRNVKLSSDEISIVWTVLNTVLDSVSFNFEENRYYDNGEFIINIDVDDMQHLIEAKKKLLC